MTSEESTRSAQIAILLAALTMTMAVAIAWWITPRSQTQIDGLDDVVDLLMDEQRAANAPVVLRAELLQHGHGSKYHWPTVKVLAVLKNDTTENFGDELRLAHYGWGEGVPSGRSTIYLVHYNSGHPEYGWKLDESIDDPKRGFSHHNEYSNATNK